MAHKVKPRPAPVPPLDFDHRPFDAAVLADIVDKTGHAAEKDCVAFNDAVNTLNMAAVRLKQAQEAKALPTAWDAVQRLKLIRRRAEGLREVLPWEEALPFLDSGVADNVEVISCLACGVVQHAPAGQICPVCQADWMCEACRACQTCEAGKGARNHRNNEGDHGNRDDKAGHEGQQCGRVDRQLDRGTLRLFERAMNAQAPELMREVGDAMTPEWIFDAPDASILMDQFLEQLDLLIASCTIAGDQLRGHNVEVRGEDPASVFVSGACDVYRRLFEVDRLEFSRHADKGMPTGPLIRFLDACCRVVLDEDDMKTAEALAADVTKVRARAKARNKG